jgi:4-alpha-glucanotransferase
MDIPRSSGILLHLTSLPSGKLDEEAYRFVDWLAAAGQSWWQILPLGPPDETGSPYRAASAFAAWNGFLAEPDAPVTTEEVESFVARHPYWIGAWAEFAGEGAIADQVRFEREWGALRAYAEERNVRLIGDLPIYVAPEGADERGWPELFQRGRVSGVPPDDWSATGQLWGNPLYDWATMRSTGYRWWIERFRRTFELVDVTRIDHFRAFVAYWAVSARAKTARRGVWRRGPGRALFDAAHEQLGELQLIAEDLGVITPAVERLRDALGFPGMVVLQFGFTPGEEESPHRPRNHVEHRFVYTGTHDHDTVRGWYDSLDPAVRAEVDAEIGRAGVREREPHWSLIRLAFSSPARVAMVQAQDVLGLGSEARMNMPGTAAGAWKWRLDRLPTAAHGRRLRAATEAADRLRS